MVQQKVLDAAYIKCAFAIAEMSQATRKKVGAIVVAKNGGIIAEGFNGTPNGFDNCCEELGETKLEVVHAEANAIVKIAKSSNSSDGGTLYCTLSPCPECAKLIIQAGIKRVVYAERYPYVGRSGDQRAVGLELLEKTNIKVEKYE